MKTKIDPGFWVGLLMIAGLFFFCSKCSAQQKHTAVIDTMACHVECIKQYVQKTTASGNVRIYAIYNDRQRGISDLIPVSKSVYEYISMCKEYNIVPSLGIKLRDGRISSIIKLKTIYRRRAK